MQVTGAVHRSHPAYADHFLNVIALDESCTRLQLTAGGSRFVAQRLCDILSVQIASNLLNYSVR